MIAREQLVADVVRLLQGCEGQGMGTNAVGYWARVDTYRYSPNARGLIEEARARYRQVVRARDGLLHW